MQAENKSAHRILVVDDDEAVRQVLQSILMNAGYSTDIACNGKEALSLMSGSGFDLIITDLVMPEQEGIETIKRLRVEYPDVKVIAMSGAFGGDYLQIARFLGAHQTLLKPIRLETVLRTVKQTLED